MSLLSTDVSNKLCTSHDINDRLGGTSFKSSYDWKGDRMLKEFLKWTAESFGKCFTACFSL